jgi:hypothetical protein
VSPRRFGPPAHDQRGRHPVPGSRCATGRALLPRTARPAPGGARSASRGCRGRRAQASRRWSRPAAGTRPGRATDSRRGTPSAVRLGRSDRSSRSSIAGIARGVEPKSPRALDGRQANRAVPAGTKRGGPDWRCATLTSP